LRVNYRMTRCWGYRSSQYCQPPWQDWQPCHKVTKCQLLTREVH